MGKVPPPVIEALILATDTFRFAGMPMRLSATKVEGEPVAKTRMWLDIAQARMLAEIRRQACIAPRLEEIPRRANG